MNNLDPSEVQRLSGGSKAKAVPSVHPGWCFESHFLSSTLSWCPPTWALMTSQKHLWHLRKSSSDKGARHRHRLALVKRRCPTRGHDICSAAHRVARVGPLRNAFAFWKFTSDCSYCSPLSLPAPSSCSLVAGTAVGQKVWLLAENLYKTSESRKKQGPLLRAIKKKITV